MRATWYIVWVGLFAEDLGVPGDATLAWAWIGIAGIATLLVANAAAAVPGWRAGRIQPAIALRAE